MVPGLEGEWSVEEENAIKITCPYDTMRIFKLCCKLLTHGILQTEANVRKRMTKKLAIYSFYAQ